jgi:hypothetical protein
MQHLVYTYFVDGFVKSHQMADFSREKEAIARSIESGLRLVNV